METEIIVAYCICDDVVKSLGIRENIQVTMKMAEILTTAITAGLFFGGNQERARIFLYEHRYIPNMLSKSQFNRRLHAIPKYVWEIIFAILANVFKQKNVTKEYVVDSFPVTVCKNIRINRNKIYGEEEYRGKCISKHEFFYGIKVHMISTINGEPIEMVFSPGSQHDSVVFKSFDLDLPKGSFLYGDSGYTDYVYEDLVNDATGVKFFVTRKSNSKRQHEPWLQYLIQCGRKTIETTFSKISALLPKTIHAVTSAGFELKVFCFVLAYSFNCLMVTT
jgi:hypothetical protein